MKFSDFFSEKDGTGSSMRLVMNFSIFIVILVWAILCIRNNTIYSFEFKDLGFFALLIGGKEVQKFFETHEKAK